MKTLKLTLSDVKSIKERGAKRIESDGSIIYKMDVFYRFNDVSIMIGQICGNPYNEIEIHGKLRNGKEIDNSFSFCEAECSDEIFEELINE